MTPTEHQPKPTRTHNFVRVWAYRRTPEGALVGTTISVRTAMLERLLKAARGDAVLMRACIAETSRTVTPQPGVPWSHVVVQGALPRILGRAVRDEAHEQASAENQRYYADCVAGVDAQEPQETPNA